MDEDQNDQRAALASVLVTIATVLVLANYLPQCGSSEASKKIVEVEEGQACGKIPYGDLTSVPCKGDPSKSDVYHCFDYGLKKVIDQCSEGGGGGGKPDEECKNLVRFEEDIKPILTAKCISCHGPAKFDDYLVSVGRVDEYIRRISLSTEDPRRMPKFPAPELPIEEKTLFQKWKDDGLIKSQEDCTKSQPPGGKLGYKDLLSRMVADIAKVNQDDREFIRYSVASHSANLGFTEGFKEQADGLNKGLNSLVKVSPRLFKVTPIDDKSAIFRYDIRSFELTRLDWATIEKNDRVNIVGKSDLDRLLQLLTNTQKPWLHSDNLLNIAIGNARLYYQFTETKLYLRDFLLDVGVNQGQQINDNDANFIGANGSLISLQKNRLLVRYDGLNGPVWFSYDVNDNGGATRNLFEFPLLINNRNRNDEFDFDASEVLFQRPNGMIGIALFDRNGNLQNAAPLDVVVDRQNPLGDPEIDAAADCMRCHAPGFLVMKDQIRDHVIRNASNFNSDVVFKVRQLYRPDTSNVALFNVDNKVVQEAMKKLDIDPSKADPVNLAVDSLLFDYDLGKLARFLFLSTDELKACIEVSAEAREEIGQLSTGGTASFQQVLESLPDLIADCQLFEEQINGE
jgi:hypothetical protein